MIAARRSRFSHRVTEDTELTARPGAAAVPATGRYAAGPRDGPILAARRALTTALCSL